MSKSITVSVLLFVFSFTVKAQQCENCGIGTDSPSSKLHVVGCGVDSFTSTLNVTDSNGVSILFIRDDRRVGIRNKHPESELHLIGTQYIQDVSNTNRLELYHDQDSGIVNITSKYLNFKENGATRLSLEQGGNVGIGTVSPGSRLTIKGSGTTQSTSALDVTDNNGNSLLFVRDDGNVGIGTSGPNYRFEVDGWFHAKGKVVIGDTTSPSPTHYVLPLTDGTQGQILETDGNGNVSWSDNGMPTGTSGGQTIRYDGTSWIANDHLYNDGTNVGIGTNTPSDAFVVSDGTNNILAVSTVGQDVYIYDRLLENGGFELINTSGTQNVFSNLDFDTRLRGGEKIEFEFNRGVLGSFHQINTDGFGFTVGSGAANFGTDGKNIIAFEEGVEPKSSPANLVQVYAREEGGFTELFVRDETGNVTLLSPHALDAPTWLYDTTGTVPPQIDREINFYTGHIRFTNNTRKNKLTQMMIEGQQLPSDSMERQFVYVESFQAYNARTGSNLQVEDWEANQDSIDARRQRAIQQWEQDSIDYEQALSEYNNLSEEEKEEVEEPTFDKVKPEPYTKKNPPTWLRKWLNNN